MSDQSKAFDYYEGLKNLAAMRLMHAMPRDKARKTFSRVYGETSMEEMLERRLCAIATFKAMFPGDPEPKGGKLFEDLKDYEKT